MSDHIATTEAILDMTIAVTGTVTYLDDILSEEGDYVQLPTEVMKTISSLLTGQKQLIVSLSTMLMDFEDNVDKYIAQIQ